MWPDQVSNPGPIAYNSDALLTALRNNSDSDSDVGQPYCFQPLIS